MTNALIFLAICAVLTFVGLFFKIIDKSSAIVIVLLLILLRLVMGTKVFYLTSVGFALIIGLRLLLKKTVRTAYDKIFPSPYSLDNAIASFGLSFCFVAILILCIEFFPSASHDFNFCRLAFFASLGTSFSIELSEICNGFAKTGIRISDSTKCSPYTSGVVTVFGALAGFIASFAFGISYYFIHRTMIPSILSVLLSFIGYLLYSLLTEKLKYSIEYVKDPNLPETATVTELYKKTHGIEGFTKSVITLITLIIIIAVALVIGYILK